MIIPCISSYSSFSLTHLVPHITILTNLEYEMNAIYFAFIFQLFRASKILAFFSRNISINIIITTTWPSQTYSKRLILESSLTLSWRRPISYRNQSIDLLGKSMDWFLYDIGLCHERVNNLKKGISRSQIFFKIGVFKNIAILTEKHPCWSLFFIKLQALGLNLY